MYRTLSKKTMFIYCDNPDCHSNCGKFHKPGPIKFSMSIKLKVHKPSISEPEPKLVPDDDNIIKDVRNQRQPLHLNASRGADVNSSQLSVSHNDSTPVSQMSMASTITLDDIIASARQKIEADFQPIVLPSPTYLDNVPKSDTISKTSKKGSQAGQTNFEELKKDYIPRLIDSDEETGYWFDDDPPSLIIDEDMADMEELIKATQAPSDHYSNPIKRGADPYKKEKKKNFDSSSSADVSVVNVTYSQSPDSIQNNFSDAPSASSPGNSAIRRKFVTI